MQITYIEHSGFLVETKNSYYLFDYYRGFLPHLDANKPIIVFASHFHEDHYQPGIFPLLKEMGCGQIFAVLAKDIAIKKHPHNVDVLRAYANETYTLPRGEQLETLLSTDSGVAYLLTTEEGVVYHAGDLNDWTWEEETPEDNRMMRGNYRHEIGKLRGRQVDVAMLPLDPRQEIHYAEGLRFFLEQVKPGIVFPMHYWDEPQIIQQFLREYHQYTQIIQNTEQYRKETPYELSNDSRKL